MRFLFGVAFGAFAMWAYRGRKVQSLTSSAPEPMQQVFNKAAQRINEVVDNDEVRQIASTVQDKVLRTKAPQPEKRGDQSSAPAPSANKVDRPLPGSDGPAPGPNASGFAQPIEAAERGSGVGPGNPTPTQKAQASKPSEKEDPK